ncbi:MAG: L,D-transpeptidase family protein [Candidatus Omnitrophica bacterium]|nr:L,D-transpeptidase family protein [Candidatus Omnitrophota bacterium]MCB9720495.1 L,D-transpeptidase family protein [Candidatus Omnitrophota bacterium]
MFNRRNIIIAAVVAAAGILLLLMLGGGGSDDKPRVKIQEGTANAQSQQEAAPQELFEQAMAYKAEGELPKAQQILRLIYNEYIDYEHIEEVQRELEAINMRIIFSNAPSPSAVIHEVVKGDTLGELAKKYGTTIELIKRSNNLDSNIIRIGQKLRIWRGEFNIFVDKSQNILILKEGDNVIKVYNVSTGKNNSTPVGSFKITSKLTDPVWFNKGVVVPPESPANVLGSRWLGFDIPGYGIHGTVDPDKIGQQVTAGCVRMRNSDVEELYSIIPVGTQVAIVN